MKPATVSDEAWARARQVAAGDRTRLADLVRRGVVRRDGSRNPLPLPPRVDPTIRPRKDKRKKKR